MRFFKWRIPPSMIVGGVALTFVALSVLTSFAQRIGMLDPRVLIEPVAADEAVAERPVRTPLTPPAIDGEVIRTTERLREISGLTTALALYAAHERIEGRSPRTVSELFAGVAAQGLMPPGIVQEAQPGMLTAMHLSANGQMIAHGNLFVRYRPQPIGIEVVSIGKEMRDGPALIMRVPDETASDEGASYFMATRFIDVKVPQAFADESEVVALGWSRESLRAMKMVQEERQSLREWTGKRAF